MMLLMHMTCIADAAMLMASRFPLVTAAAEELGMLTHLYSDAAVSDRQSTHDFACLPSFYPACDDVW